MGFHRIPDEGSFVIATMMQLDLQRSAARLPVYTDSISAPQTFSLCFVVGFLESAEVSRAPGSQWVDAMVPSALALDQSTLK